MLTPGELNVSYTEIGNYNLSPAEVETLIEGAAASPHTTLYNVVMRFAPWYSSQIENLQAGTHKGWKGNGILPKIKSYHLACKNRLIAYTTALCKATTIFWRIL